MKRNANGNGSVRKISVARDGKTYTYWQARYSAGFDPGTGKQKQHSITGKTQKEVLQKLKAATAAIDNGSYIEPSAMTVAQWLQSWSDNYLEGIKPSTAYLYRRSIALYLTPNLGAVKLCALKTQQIQAFYNDLLRPGKKNAEPLSPKTIKNIHGILHKALQQAVANGDIRQNPADACSLPKVVRKEMAVFDDDAAAAFLRAIDGHPHELLYKIALFTGMREGELLGLTWDCIDFTNGMISVRQQARQEQKKGGQYYFSTPKNGKGRVLTVPQSVLALFRAQQDKQKEMAAHAGTAWDNVHNLVFTNAAGSFLSHRTPKRDAIRMDGISFWQAAPIKISAVFLVFSMVSAFFGKVFGACCFILLVAAVQPKKILWDLWNPARSARFCQRSAPWRLSCFARFRS